MSALNSPWIVSDDDDSDFFLVGPDSGNGLVCSPVFRTHDEKLACLFAAAPELLEALQEALRLLESSLIRGCEFQPGSVGWKARAAIAKAGGAA